MFDVKKVSIELAGKTLTLETGRIARQADADLFISLHADAGADPATRGRAPRPRLAVLIDAENARAAQAAQLMAQVAKFGKATARRAYGDWTTTQLAPWKKLLHTLSIRPCQQFRFTRARTPPTRP